jgi:hypothetical protein
MAQQYWLTQKDYQMIYAYLENQEFGIPIEKKYTYNTALSVFKEMLMQTKVPFFGEAASKTQKEMSQMDNPNSDAYRQMSMLFSDQVRYQMISQVKAGFPDLPTIALHEHAVKLLAGRPYPLFTLLNKHLKKAGVNFYQMIGESLNNQFIDFEVYKHYHKAIIKKTYVPQSEEEKENLLKLMDNYSRYASKFTHKTTLDMFIYLSEELKVQSQPQWQENHKGIAPYPKERIVQQIFDFMQNNRTIEFKQHDKLKILQTFWKEGDFAHLLKNEMQAQTLKNFLNPEVNFFRKMWLENQNLAIVEVDTTGLAKQKGMDVNTIKNNCNIGGKFLEKALKADYETCKFNYSNQLAELKVSSNDAKLHQDIENFFNMVIAYSWNAKYIGEGDAKKIWNKLLLEEKLSKELPENDDSENYVQKMKI